MTDTQSGAIPRADKPYGSRIYANQLHDGSWEASVSGVTYGPNLTVHSINKEVIVLHSPGHKYWNGRGSQGYVSPKLLVYAITSGVVTEEQGGFSLGVIPLVTIDQGRKKS